MTALDSERYFALLDTLERPFTTLADEPTLDEIRAGEHGRLRKAVQALSDESTDEELHATRILVKRARYAAELEGDRPYVQAAKRLQDVLGEHQDAVVATAELRRLADRMPDTALAAGRLVDREQERARQSRDEWRLGMEAAGEDGVIRACGGVIERDGRVVAVHRPKYDDWSLPKGKAHRGESDEDCAATRDRGGDRPARSTWARSWRRRRIWTPPAARSAFAGGR